MPKEHFYEVVTDLMSKSFRCLSRRDFLRTAKAVALGASVPEVLWAASLKAAIPDAQSKKTFSVRDFGATGDGATDDSRAFREAAAAAAGGVLFVPPGNYLLLAAVLLPSNIVVIGTGHDSTIIGYVDQYIGASGQSNITLQSLQFVTSTSVHQLFSTCNVIRILNCRFNGKLTNSDWYLGGMGARFNGCRNIAIVDSQFIDYNDALYFDKEGRGNSDLVTVKGCRFSQTGRGNKHSYPAQVYQYNCDRLIVDECTFLNILPGNTGVAGRQSYAVYEGDGTAVETVVKNCKDVITEPDLAGLHTGILTSQNKTTMVSNNEFDFHPTSNGYSFKNGGSYLVSFVANKCSGAAFLALPVGATCAFIVENNIFKNISLGNGGSAVRIGANARRVSRATIRGNQIMHVQGGGILINLCDYAIVAENRILNVNTLNTTYTENNAWQVSGISFYGSDKGLVSGNHIENTQGGSGHAKFGISVGGRQHDVDVRPENISLRMEIRAVSAGGGI